jgi:hypothetical protein
VLPHTQHYTLVAPPGAPEGHEVIYEGEGDENPEWETGDVIIRIRSRKKNGGWRRKESSLYWTESIGIDEVIYLIHACMMCSDVFVIGAVRVRTKFNASRWSYCGVKADRCYTTRQVASRLSTLDLNQYGSTTRFCANRKRRRDADISGIWTRRSLRGVQCRSTDTSGSRSEEELVAHRLVSFMNDLTNALLSDLEAAFRLKRSGGKDEL